MTEDQFYLRIIFIVIFGVALILTSIYLAKKNNKEPKPEKHKEGKVISIILLVLAAFLLWVGVGSISFISFPAEMSLASPLNHNEIIRKPSVVQHWGYPTDSQWFVFSNISDAFVIMSLAAYCAFFRNSYSSWWKKLLKILYFVCVYTFYLSATNWRFFDIWDFIPTIIFVICLVLPRLFRDKSSVISENPVEVKSDEEKGGDAVIKSVNVKL